MAQGDVLEAASRLVEALEKAGFDYAIGGAIALAYWGVPRATVDVDVGVACEPMQLPHLLETLKSAGCVFDEESAAAAAERGDFGCRLLGVRIDVFLPILPLARAALDRRVRVPLGAVEAWVVTSEDAAAFKLLFGRTKDFADLERLFAVRGSRLDLAYLDEWVERLFTVDDPRRLSYLDLRRRVAQGIPG